MEKVNISLFKELYYWTYFYSKKIRKNSPFGPKYTAFMVLSLLRTYTFFCLCFFIYYIFKEIGWDILEVIIHNINDTILFVIVMTPFISLYYLDFFLFFKKSDEIIVNCGQFSKKKESLVR